MTHQSQTIITFDVKYVFPFKTITSKWNTWSDNDNATFWSFRKPYSPAGEEAWVSWSTWAESKQEKLGWHHMEVSCNRGTPKSSIWIGFSIKPSSYWGTLSYGNPYIFFSNEFPPDNYLVFYCTNYLIISGFLFCSSFFVGGFPSSSMVCGIYSGSRWRRATEGQGW